MPETTAVNQQQIRAQFPALKNGFVFFENAGGSQLPKQVIERMQSFMVDAYVQTGADYPSSDLATETAYEAKKYANVLMNGDGAGKTLIGPSTTDLIYRLANMYRDVIETGDEIVISIANHESNIGHWARLEGIGAQIKWWGVDPKTGDYSYDDLGDLISAKTKLVTVAHTSNLLGDVLDVRRVADMAHSVGAQVVVDGVAFAAHQAIDVQAWDADFYALSFYKAYGPHIAALYGKDDAWARLKGPNHDFIKDGEFPWKFELGCQPYEALAGVLGLADYLAFVAGSSEGSRDRATVESAFSTFRDFELPVQKQLVDYLLTKPQVRLVGPRSSGEERHPTICFLHDSMDSEQVVGKVNSDKVGIRYGHMYASRLCEVLGAPLDSGFVRISAVHYNTTEEADFLIDALDAVL